MPTFSKVALVTGSATGVGRACAVRFAKLGFAVVVNYTNSYRPAILALIVFFVVGFLILLFVDVEKAIHDAGNETPAEREAEAL